MKMKAINGFFGKFRWLSNFWYLKFPIIYDDKEYKTVEHAYQAAKMVTEKHKNAIRNSNTPGQAKRLARKFPIRKDWDEIKFDIMKKLVKQKFLKNQDLKRKLLATRNAYIEETNQWGDTYWGVCRNKGENNLGKILMLVRDEINQNITINYANYLHEIKSI